MDRRATQNTDFGPVGLEEICSTTKEDTETAFKKKLKQKLMSMFRPQNDKAVTR